MSTIPLYPLKRGMATIVDDDDFDYLNQFKWYAFRTKTKWYASRNIWIPGEGLKSGILMHREILGAVKGEQVDHEDGDGLNNQRRNIRKCSQSQNNANQKLRTDNTSGFKGVWWHKIGKKWAATAGNHYLGLFSNPEDAARAYDEYMEKNFHDFAKTNKSLNLI